MLLLKFLCWELHASEERTNTELNYMYSHAFVLISVNNRALGSREGKTTAEFRRDFLTFDKDLFSTLFVLVCLCVTLFVAPPQKNQRNSGIFFLFCALRRRWL